MINSYRYASVISEPNLIIGGEGVSTTSAAQLETLLGLSAGDVSYFELVGNDIHAHINLETWEVPISAFENNLDITGFNDLESRCERLGTYSFRGATNLSSLAAEGVVYCDISCFENCSSLVQHVYLPNCTLMDANAFKSSGITEVTYVATGNGSSSFNSCVNLVTVNNPNLQTIGNYGFAYCTSLANIDLSGITNFGVYGLLDCVSLAGEITNNVVTGLSTGAFFNTGITRFVSSSLTSIGTSTFWNTDFVTLDMDTDMPNCTSTGSNAFRNCQLLTTVTANNLTAAGSRIFYVCSALTSISMTNPSLSIGTTTGDDSCFLNVPDNGSITIDSSHQVSNGFSEEGDVAYLRTKGWAINYI